jgi:hypothetical protein
MQFAPRAQFLSKLVGGGKKGKKGKPKPIDHSQDGARRRRFACGIGRRAKETTGVSRFVRFSVQRASFASTSWSALRRT